MDLNQIVSAQVQLPSTPRVIALALGELQGHEPDLHTIAHHLKEDPVLTPVNFSYRQ